MKKISLIFLAAVLFFVFIAARNNSPKLVIGSLLKKGEIRQGELVYRINLFGFIPVGEAVFAQGKVEEVDGRRVYHLNVTASTLKILAKFYSCYAVIDSYVDAENYSPLVFKQKLMLQDKPDNIKAALYNQKEGFMSVSGVRRQILPDTQDPLSAIFNLRRMDFAKTKDFEININTNQKNYILKGKAEEKEIELNKKIYKIVLAEASIARGDKSPYHKSNIAMVLLKEKENLPILIKVFASGVLINAKLIEIK